MESYDFQAGGVPMDVPFNALDNELMQLHAIIIRLWLEIGERISSIAWIRRGIDKLQIYPGILSLILTHWIIPQQPCKRRAR